MMYIHCSHFADDQRLRKICKMFQIPKLVKLWIKQIYGQNSEIRDLCIKPEMQMPEIWGVIQCNNGKAFLLLAI